MPVVAAAVRAVRSVVPELVACIGCPRYEAVIVSVPGARGGTVTGVQACALPVVESVLALPSVQLEAEKVPPLFVKLTVPVGAVAEPGVASVTVAVQLVEIGRASCRDRV